MALVVFVVGAARPTAPEYALARYAAEAVDLFGHTTLIARTATAHSDAVVTVTRTARGFTVLDIHITEHDLEVHGCGATLAADADDALRMAVAQFVARLDGGVLATPDELVSAPEALRLQHNGALLLDVRSNGPHPQVIPGALHSEKDAVTTLGLPRNAPIVVFCNGESGSARVVRALREHGYTDVRHVRGGFAALASATNTSSAVKQESYAHLG